MYIWIWETPGGRDFGMRGIWVRGGKWGDQFTSNLHGNEVDRILSQQGGFQVSKGIFVYIMNACNIMPDMNLVDNLNCV
jgi:hypothetical protein